LPTISYRHTGLAWAVVLICLFSFPSFGDEILFQNQKGPQTGVVVGEDDHSVTIRFRREMIKSITKGAEESPPVVSGKVIWQEGKDYVMLKIPRGSIQVVPQTSETVSPPLKTEPLSSDTYQIDDGRGGPTRELPEKIGTAGIARGQIPARSMNTQHELLREEMGSVQGMIMWQGKPLQNSKVKIVLETYTGFSLAALKRLFAKDMGKTDEITLDTQTDAKGHYVFAEVPPGAYRLYWMPDVKAGWIHRLREKPDLEVTSGSRTVANIPEK
jgi:hypothetical protein